MPPVMQSREQDQLRRSTNIYGRTQIYGRDKDFPAYAVRRAREAFLTLFQRALLAFCRIWGYGKLLETIRFGSKIKT